MAYDAADKYEIDVQNNGSVYVPAVERERSHASYNDEVAVTLFLENDVVDSLEFRAYITASASITIPISIRRRFNLGDEVTVSFDSTGERWTPEAGATARKGIYEQAHPEEQSLEAVTDIVADD